MIVRSFLMAPVLGVFLACSQVDKPGPLNITERNPARCEQAWMVFDNYRNEVERQFPGAKVEVLAGEDAFVFIAAFNLTAPPSDYGGDTVVLFTKDGSIGVLVSFIRDGCVQMAAAYHSVAIDLWRRGIVPGASPLEKSLKDAIKDGSTKQGEALELINKNVTAIALNKEGIEDMGDELAQTNSRIDVQWRAIQTKDGK